MKIIHKLSVLLPWAPSPYLGNREALTTPEFMEWYYVYRADMKAAGISLHKADDKKIKAMWRADTDGQFVDIEFRTEYQDSLPNPFTDPALRPYQNSPVGNLIIDLEMNGACLDTSDTGVGKTYASLIAMKRMNRKPIIVCPHNILTKWKDTCAELNIEPLLVVNYELLRNGRHSRCKKVGKNFVWMADHDTGFIFDEVHHCSGRNTLQAGLLIAAKRTAKPIAMLSATAADDPMGMRAIGFTLGLHSLKDFYEWVRKYGVVEGFFTKFEYKGGKVGMMKLHSEIFPHKAIRIRRDELGSEFPETQITAEIHDLSEKAEKEIKEAWDNATMMQFDKETKTTSEVDASPIVKAIRARQISELHKVPVLTQMARDAQAEGMSVVIFVNYQKTVDALKKEFQMEFAYDGSTDKKIRDVLLERFQCNLDTILVGNLAALCEGNDLHDIYGGHPRLALFSPTDNARHLKQGFGRIWRQGGKTKSIQKIIFANTPIETKICQRVQAKLFNYNLLNDGDLGKDFIFNLEESHVRT